MKIGVDIDGVMCDLVSEVLRIIRKKYRVSLRKNDIYKHEICEILGVTKNEFFKVFEEALSKLEHPAIKDAPYYINKLNKKHKVIIITSRLERFNHITKEWLTLNKIQYNQLINIETDKHTKLDKLDIFVDDNLKEIILASRIKHLKLILFDQPWNKSLNIKNLFTRARTWKEVYSLITKGKKTYAGG